MTGLCEEVVMMGGNDTLVTVFCDGFVGVYIFFSS